MAESEPRAEDNGHAETAAPVAPRCVACGAQPVRVGVRTTPVNPIAALSTFFCAGCGAVFNCQVNAVERRVMPATAFPRAA